MVIPKAVSQNPVASFALATLALQVSVILSCLILRSVYLSAPSSISSSTSSSAPRMPAAASADLTADPAARAFGAIDADPAAGVPALGVDEPMAAPVPEPLPVHENREVMHVVKSGDTFTKIWTTYGGTVSGALRASKALEKAGITGTALRQGEKIALTLDPQGDIIELRRKLRDGRGLVIEGSSRAGYSVRVTEVVAKERERVASGSISRSFARAAEDQNIPYAVINELVDIFGGQIEFSKQVRRGDTFSVIYSERVSEDGEHLDAAGVRAASFKVNGKSYAAIRHIAKDGSTRYFDASGEPLGNFFLRYPVQYTRISSMFSTARFHPVLKRHRPHNGVDFAAPIGTPVRAVADGKVVTAGYIGDAGNMIKIQHGERYATAYLHLSKITKGLRKGSHVKRGDIIGTVGMTGLASGPHLHFSFYDRGVYVNPLEIDLPRMPQQGERIPAGYLQATLKLLSDQHYKVQLASLSELVSPNA